MLSGAENMDPNAEEETVLGEFLRIWGARCDSSRAWGGESWLGGCRSDGAMLTDSCTLINMAQAKAIRMVQGAAKALKRRGRVKSVQAGTAACG